MATHSRDWGAWWAAICGVTQTQLKRLGGSSSSIFSMSYKHHLYLIPKHSSSQADKQKTNSPTYYAVVRGRPARQAACVLLHSLCLSA